MRTVVNRIRRAAQKLNGRYGMATWKCSCGFSKEGRCKPQKCEKCGEKGQFVKAE
jgi:rubrerythrin